MSLLDFKKRIASKYDSISDNIIVSIGDKEYRGSTNKVDESKLNIQTDLGINEYTVVKIDFKDKPKTINDSQTRDARSTSKKR
jgi:hypothetical protein